MESITRHLSVIALASIVGIAMWLGLRVSGVEFALEKDAPIEGVTVFSVISATILSGFLAWGAHAAIVRVGLSKYWTLIGSGALAFSLIGPSRLATGETLLSLIAMHIVVGWILIIGLVVATSRHEIGTHPRLSLKM